MLISLIGLLSIAAWVYLLLGRGFFWLERPAPPRPASSRSPFVAVIIPARNEAQTIERVVRSLLSQDYPGDYRVVLVDDHSTDGTAAIARRAAEAASRSGCLETIPAPQLEPGWSGKLWALNAGIEYVSGRWPEAELFLLTDADIDHPSCSLRHLVARSESGTDDGRPYDLVSLMARLNCRNFAEKLMIPAFVFFFEMLYPFSWIRTPRNRTAGAAGGIMLLRRRALEQAGGLAAIRDTLIDDCSLAGIIKRAGPIWLGLAEDTVSLRSYSDIDAIWQMIARTAFTQLRYSTTLLAGTVLGLFVTYLAPPLLLWSGWAGAAWGATAWLLMTVAYWPTVKYYRLNPLWAVTLPFTALIYTAATVDSARRYWMGRGGEWKGRSQAPRREH